METLPAVVGDVTVPEYLSPSALGSWGGCPLKLVAASQPRAEWKERLASGPEASIGTLLHRILERGSTPEAVAPVELFDEEYQALTKRLREDPRRAHFADLSSTKSPSEWARLRAWVVSRARASAPNAADASRPSREGRGRALTGAEIQFDSRVLRLRGKADRVKHLGSNSFEVRDFKTGAVLDEDGEIKAEIALQLRAYGLLLLEQQPRARVRLVVDDGADRDVAFDENDRRAAADSIQEVAAAIPPPGSARADSISQPGGGCWGCSVRHVCPGYRGAAPSWWKKYPNEIDRVPYDVWGMVLEVHGAGTVDVVMRDDAGRRVRIDGLSDRHGIGSSSVGARLWFFGLEASGASRGFDGARFHPRTFHELPRDRMERRAWGVHVFDETAPEQATTEKKGAAT